MSQPAPQIRGATPDDVPLLHELITALALYERAPDAVKASLEDLRTSLFGEGVTAHALICEQDGQALGFAVYFFNYSTWLGRNGLYLEDLFVRPEARGRGAGLAL
ncbi:GNAT family N-acetyltransferase, partial [Xanthomonas oryzae]